MKKYRSYRELAGVFGLGLVPISPARFDTIISKLNREYGLDIVPPGGTRELIETVLIAVGGESYGARDHREKVMQAVKKLERDCSKVVASLAAVKTMTGTRFEAE